MEWLRTHQYASALSAAGLLVLIGIVIVVGKSSATPSNSQPLTWGGAGTVFGAAPTQGGAPAQQNAGDMIQQVQSAAPYTYIPITAPQDSTDATSSDSFDFNAFVSMLSTQGKAAPSSSASSNTSAGAYAFIPGGLVSTSSLTKTRTPLQDTLYSYGNDVGGYIQSFEQQYPNETQILTNQVQDRTNPDKAAAVEALGQSLSGLGASLTEMDAGDSTDAGGNQNVPIQMKSAHDALAKSYSDLGVKLALVPQATSDSDFLAAINAYDTSVQAFTKTYVAYANLFVAYGVSFSPEDPGSVFTFTQATL
jgi:hypothetical protein